MITWEIIKLLKMWFKKNPTNVGNIITKYSGIERQHLSNLLCICCCPKGHSSNSSLKTNLISEMELLSFMFIRPFKIATWV